MQTGSVAQSPLRMFARCRVAVLSVVFCLVLPVQAADLVLVIGGGDQVGNSQAQIEANTRWVRQVLEALPGSRRVDLYFTDGSDPAPDVTEWSRPSDEPGSLQPLARVFDADWSNGQSFRNHGLSVVAGGTRRDRLIPALSDALAGLGQADRLFLVFNGHGTWDQDDSLGNRIMLWDDTSLDVRELEQILDLAPPTASVRFVFTQCYAGAFAALARPGVNRCGFLAEAADQPAEGCSAALDHADFQDYSSHFFAALAGRDRFGDALAIDPDLGGNQAVSPLEAHYYSLVAADSSDIPRATSEVFLLQWKPWYLALLQGLYEGDDSPYRGLAERLAQRKGLALDRSLEPQLAEGLALAEDQMQGLLGEQEQAVRRIDQLQAPMEREFLRRWPGAGYAYTRNFQRFLEQDWPLARAFILSHPDYPELVRVQDGYWELEDRVLEAERRVSGFERIAHLLNLARRQALLEAWGDDSERSRYQELIACEADPLALRAD